MILFLPSALLETEKAAVNSEESEAEAEVTTQAQEDEDDEGHCSFSIFLIRVCDYILEVAYPPS